MSSSKAFLFILLSFLVGVFIASFVGVPKLIIGELFVLGVFYSSVFFRQKAILVLGLCLIVLGIGIFRAQSVLPPETPGITPIQNITKSSDRTILLCFGLAEQLKQKFSQVINSNLSPPQGSILAAVLIGDKRQISSQWQEKLNRAGVRHITAISGMHIIIISSLLLQLGIMLGLYRGQAFYFAVLFLWLFILMIGLPPSAVRAGVMGTMVLFCEKIGRQKSADRALFLTAAVMLAISPTLLRHSIGFQLSFLATLGIIYLMPIFQVLFQKILSTRPTRPRPGLGRVGRVGDLLAMTLAAQVFTLPVLIYRFGQVSVVSPITNILIVPVLSYLMVAGFVFLIAGAIFQPLGLVFIFPVRLFLSYITKVTEFFAGLPFSAVSFHLHWLWLIIIYLLLAVIVWQTKKHQKFQFS